MVCVEVGMIKRKNKHEYVVQFGSLSTKPYTPNDLDEARKWCTTLFGPGGRNNKCQWRFGWIERDRDTFHFKFEKDAIWFTIRWS